MRIIPAIDIIDAKCVRLTKGDYNQKTVYNENPVEVAKAFEDAGIKYLHLVDLDGAKSKQIVNYKVLESIATQTNLHIDFGGGIKSNEDIKMAFESGAKQVTGGSIAVSNQPLFLEWIKTYGNEKIILGADSKNRKIATQGWLTDSDLDVLDFISEYESKGIQQVICTDISKDGMLQGPSIDLYKEILSQTTIQLTASGGVSQVNDLYDLKAIGCESVIIGKAIYENRISFTDLIPFL